MALSTGSIQPLTLEGIRKLVGDSFRRYPLEFKSYMNVNPATKAREFDREVVGIGSLAIKAENAPIVPTDPRVGREKGYTFTVFAGGIRVSWEADMDDLYGWIRRHMRSLGMAMNETMNIEGAAPFNRADSGDASPLLGFDGLALLHDTHTNLDGTDTLTYKDNRLLLDISESAIQTLLIQFEGVQDASDNRVNVGRANRLLHHRDTMFLLREILQSEGKPFTGDNTKNVIRGIITPELLHFATDSDRWIVQTDMHDMNFFIRHAPVVDSYDDKQTLSSVNTIAARFGVGHGEWRPVIGSPGAP